MVAMLNSSLPDSFAFCVYCTEPHQKQKQNKKTLALFYILLAELPGLAQGKY